MNLDLPPQLILPDHYEARRPAIIRPDVDPGRYFPVGLTRTERRAIVAELRRAGRLDEAFLPGMVPIVSTSQAPLSVTFLTGNYVNNTATSATFTSVTLGTEYTHLVIAGGYRNGAGNTSLITGCTVGGDTASLLVRRAGANCSSALWVIEKSAASGNIVLTTGVSAAGGYAFAVYGLTGLQSMTPLATDAATDSSADTPIPLSVSASGGSYVFATALIWNMPSGGDWTGDITGTDFSTWFGNTPPFPGMQSKAAAGSGGTMNFSSADPGTSNAHNQAVAAVLR